jgi:hypothetical protein
MSIAGMGDLDNDGCDDYVAGAFTLSGGGAAILVSGRTGRFLRAGYDEIHGDGIGWSVTNCGDLDGDGAPDFAAGSQGYFGQPVVRVFSGRTAQPLYSYRSNVRFSRFGHVVASNGTDLDRDGVPDLVVGAPGPGSNALHVFSGRDGMQIGHVPPIPVSTWSIDQGSVTAVLPPQPGSPYGAFIAIEPNYGAGSTNPNEQSRIRLRA